MSININDLILNSTASLIRIVCGGSFSIVAAVIFGLIRYSLPDYLKRNLIFNFLLDCFKFPPPLAYIPFVILIFGIGFKASLAIVFIGVFPAVSTATYDALGRIPREIRKTALSLEIRPHSYLLLIQLPAILPELFTGIRTGLTMGWMSIIAAEMISGDQGLGYSLQANRINLNLSGMIGDMICIAIIGYLLNFTIKKIEKWVVKWQP